MWLVIYWVLVWEETESSWNNSTRTAICQFHPQSLFPFQVLVGKFMDQRQLKGLILNADLLEWKFNFKKYIIIHISACLHENQTLYFYFKYSNK